MYLIGLAENGYTDLELLALRYNVDTAWLYIKNYVLKNPDIARGSREFLVYFLTNDRSIDFDDAIPDRLDGVAVLLAIANNTNPLRRA